MPPKGVDEDELTTTGTTTDETTDAFADPDLTDGVDELLNDDGEDAPDDDEENEAVPGLTTETLDDDAPVEKPAGAGPDRGDGRDTSGKFASKEEQDAADRATADAKKAGKSPAEQTAAATKAAGEAKAAAGATADTAPKWEPFHVKADRALHPIEGAQVTRQAGNVIIAVPEKDFKDFEHRIGRGIALERQVRDIQQRSRELEFERTAPKPRSDAEIEADILLDQIIRPNLEKLFVEDGEGNMVPFLDPKTLENVKLKVEIAKRDEKTTFAKKESDRRAEVESGESWQRDQIEQLTDQAFELAENHPELKGMTPEQIKTALEELAMPARDKIIYRENGETFANTEYLFKLLKREFLASGRSTAPAPAGTPAAPKKTQQGERFNKGQESAAAPRSTSLKDGRTSSAPANRRPTRETVPPSKQRTEAQQAEDDFRNLRRRMSRSDSLDFDDEDA